MHARQVLYQLSYIPSPAFLVLSNGSALGRQSGLQGVKHLGIHQTFRSCWAVGYSKVEGKGMSSQEQEVGSNLLLLA